MDRINELLTTNIKFFLEYLLYGLNYYAFKIETLIIIFLFFTGIIFVIYNRKKYLYRYELAIYFKTCIFILIVGTFIKILDIKTIMPVFDVVFYKLRIITILGVLLVFILDKFVFFKSINNLKVEIRYLNYIITVTYIFLLISNIYQIKDIILLILWQINLISMKFLIENRNCVKKEKNCVLYENRRKQLNILKDIIRDSKYENYAIAINGEWGSGKSEFISALINDCDIDNNYYVYIKPMVSDTQESLIIEFQKGISRLMKGNGIHSGKNSSLDKYFKEIFKLLQINSKVTLADFIELKDKDVSYKELKQELQDDIDSLLKGNNKRIITVIDDFDRVNENEQIEILSFIKEIIDFNGCITIIALDYENLTDNTIVKPTFLEKFIATRLHLVDMEFKEIIEYHSRDILNENFLDNDFAKEILEDINMNIYDYYNNIEQRVNTFYEKKNDEISKSKDNKEKDKEYLNEFQAFHTERSKYIHNSRRVIHFLNELKNTVVFIDKLYKNRADGQQMLSTFNVSEVIYFFNYIKVFYKDAYASIIKLKGIEEYCSDLIWKNRKLEEEYFRIILGNIIPRKNYFFIDEQIELKRKNALDLIKDLFINYHFSKNNIELITNYEKCLDEMDNNNICINENYVETLQFYQDIIFRHSNCEKDIIDRLISLINYTVKLYEQGKIDFISILEMVTSRHYFRERAYVKYYLREAYKLVKDEKVDKIYEKDKSRMDIVLRTFENDIINQYNYFFIELLNIATLDKIDDISINDMIHNITEIEQLFQTIRKYSVDNNLINEEDNIADLRELCNLLLKKIKARKYIILDLELLNSGIEEFLLNIKYINRLKKIKTEINTIYRYEELPKNFNISDISQVKEILNDLVKQNTIDENMMSWFQNAIKFIVGNEDIIDDECKLNVMKIYKKMKKEDCWNEYGWFDIMINVERILSV